MFRKRLDHPTSPEFAPAEMIELGKQRRRLLSRPLCGAEVEPLRQQEAKDALDVSDFKRFGELMERCRRQPRIFNALGAQDPNHFSATGR